uniref:Uncharacterized protein n=1 Tax=Leersia perrieri TaxID=77586 RepID=A0A0D9X979_9ORYZ
MMKMVLMVLLRRMYKQARYGSTPIRRHWRSCKLSQNPSSGSDSSGSRRKKYLRHPRICPRR